ncbi:uncharacterized protein Z518_05238 [Rhinocladiella mackenziei CBS 650.93]|uniref:Uncharacterized protein n=1 Tax=Rhinocladiella mackenziei CBS 650.93 TaxID=1442369 RepID=A0A0D2J5N7_9EURO|nr:uncharacterized protein Z518_05238 [Rhinocladiella mackenziei CBS 650.93]KIX04370.1 hypothetical protein Z518_05238 [Rhinocladiella mackenziei CBS 650.93]
MNTNSATLQATPSAPLSFVSGPRTPELWYKTLAETVDQQAAKYGNHTAISFPWQSHKLSYRELASRSEQLAKSMLAYGLGHSDCIAIMAGNRYQYIEAFLGAARIGCPYIVVNNTYTPQELISVLSMTSCRLLFVATNIGLKGLSKHLEGVQGAADTLRQLKHIVLLSERIPDTHPNSKLCTYSTFVSKGEAMDAATLQQAERAVQCSDIVNLQFTSGTTGAPKAAMLCHTNLINNARFIAAAMKLIPSDVVCCPPPLFHCFGLVLGFLTAFVHGSTIIFPCDQFDANLVLETLNTEKCTAILGVPTMFIAEIEANKKKKYKISSVRTGLAAGSSVPPALMRQLKQEFGVQGMLIAYGMTETSPVTFITSLDDPEEKRFKTVGRICPHTGAKVIDKKGNVVPRGVPGELCVSGYALQRGYYKNPAKTQEVMKKDDQGVLWMYTGDECVIDADGYCTVTGRIKDMIIRGGENIFPAEIEERLLQHPSITEACVVAVKNEKYGEVVGAFLRLKQGRPKPSLEQIRQWVRQSLGSHKAPAHVFWIGDEGVGNDYPKTGSGKHQKHILRAVADRLVTAQGNVQAKL